MAQDEDAALFLRVARGDKAAFATLFDRHQASVVRFAFRFVGNQARAEELAQDIFVKLYKSAKGYSPSAKFKTFMFRVATNHCLNELRRPEARAEKIEMEENDGDSAERPDQAAGQITAHCEAKSLHCKEVNRAEAQKYRGAAGRRRDRQKAQAHPGAQG